MSEPQPFLRPAASTRVPLPKDLLGTGIHSRAPSPRELDIWGAALKK